MQVRRLLSLVSLSARVLLAEPVGTRTVSSAQSLALDERLAQHLRHHVVLSTAEVGRLVVVELVAHQHVLQQVGACRAAREGVRAGWGGGRRHGTLDAPEHGGSSREPKAAP